MCAVLFASEAEALRLLLRAVDLVAPAQHLRLLPQAEAGLVGDHYLPPLEPRHARAWLPWLLTVLPVLRLAESETATYLP